MRGADEANRIENLATSSKLLTAQFYGGSGSIFTRMVFCLHRIKRNVKSENILFTKWMFRDLLWVYTSNKLRVIIYHVRDIQ